MNVRDIVVDGRYVVELAPHHPIRKRRLCTVVEIVDRDNIRVTFEKYVPLDDSDKPLPGGPSKLVTVGDVARASQFLYDEEEQKRRIAEHQRRMAEGDLARRDAARAVSPDLSSKGARRASAG